MGVKFRDYMDKEYRLIEFRDGRAHDVIIKPYMDYDGVPLFKSNHISNYCVMRFGELGNILVFNDNILKELKQKHINVIIWYMIINISFKLNEYLYDISRDNIADTYVCNICGYIETLYVLNYIRETLCSSDKQKDILSKRIKYIEKAFANKVQCKLDKDKIIKNADLAFMKKEEIKDEETC